MLHLIYIYITLSGLSMAWLIYLDCEELTFTEAALCFILGGLVMPCAVVMYLIRRIRGKIK